MYPASQWALVVPVPQWNPRQLSLPITTEAHYGRNSYRVLRKQVRPVFAICLIVLLALTWSSDLPFFG
jgi:hypothetical protein